MSDDYLRLKDARMCPSCGHRSQSRKNGFCGRCGIRLFSSVGDFHQMEAAGLLPRYWAWTRDDGWKYRDHFIVHGAKPNLRTIAAARLPDDYGKKTTPANIAKRGGVLSKKDRLALA